MDDEENERLLDGGGHTVSKYSNPNSFLQLGSRPYFIFIHLVVTISLLGNLYLSLLPNNIEERVTIFPKLRHLGSITNSQHATNHTHRSMYSGPPSKQNVAAWEHLLQPLYFNASEDEIRASGALPAVSVQVKDGGYIASLGVYHELHCLNRLRYSLYSTNLTYQGTEVVIDHLDHCLEVLRMSAICRADLSVYTFSWPDAKNAQFLDAHSSSLRQCVDFEQLEDYALQRKIGLTPTLLQPTVNN